MTFSPLCTVMNVNPSARAGFTSTVYYIGTRITFWGSPPRGRMRLPPMGMHVRPPEVMKAREQLASAIAARVRGLRLSRAEAARRAGMGVSQLTDLMGGDSQRHSLEFLLQIWQRLGGKFDLSLRLRTTSKSSVNCAPAAAPHRTARSE